MFDKAPHRMLLNDSGDATFTKSCVGCHGRDEDVTDNCTGQGFFITVFEATGIIFLAWFTYDVERPPEDVMAILGEPGHRWVTAQGPFDGDTAVLDVFVSSGGVFDSPVPAVGPPVQDGTITIQWTGCNSATLTYDIPSAGQGVIPLQRVATDNVALCQTLQ